MRRLLVMLLVVPFAGCSLFVPKLEKPVLSVDSVRLIKGDLFHQELMMRMRVQNPNDRELPVRSITYQLEVDGQELAHGMSGDSFVVPALGEAEFDMSVSANMAGMLIKLLGQSNTSVEYRLSGKVALSAGLLRSIPFNQTGRFRWQ